MRLKPILIYSMSLVCLCITSCANRGTPSGGEKDTEAPIIIKSIPENYSTNFKGNEIRVYFDEYVKIKDVQNQLIISPPMDTKPVVTPLGAASKYISIKIKDTLDANTTYAFNFGQSIVDNNEENPYPYYRYVFSTGHTIDSLSVKGFVVDALKQEPDPFISVMLYQVDSTYTDSIVYNKKPRYITNTLDSTTTFSIDNIKAGTYKLVALKDINNDYKFNQKTDKIAFNDTVITVPKDTIYRLKLFNEKTNFKAFRPKQDGETKIIFPYQGDFEAMRIQILDSTPKSYSYKLVKDAATDSVYYWYSPKFEADSTLFLVTNTSYTDTLTHRYRKLPSDTLMLNALGSGNIDFDKNFAVQANIPLTKIDTSKIKLIDKDSLKIAYTVTYDAVYNRFNFLFEKEEEQRYKFKMLPGTFTDYYQGINEDTLNFNFSTKLKSDYGNMRVNIRNAKFPLIVQLIDSQGEVMYESYASTSPVIDFINITPKQYQLRAIFDTNKNGVYDTGNYLLGQQPERVSYAPKIDEVRANFDITIEFTLLDN